jgi:hypothetical protein
MYMALCTSSSVIEMCPCYAVGQYDWFLKSIARNKFFVICHLPEFQDNWSFSCKSQVYHITEASWIWYPLPRFSFRYQSLVVMLTWQYIVSFCKLCLHEVRCQQRQVCFSGDLSIFGNVLLSCCKCKNTLLFIRIFIVPLTVQVLFLSKER